MISKCDCSPIITYCIFSSSFTVFPVQRKKIIISKQQIIYHITVTLGVQQLAGPSSESASCLYQEGPYNTHPSLAPDSKTGLQKNDTVSYTYFD